MPDNQSPKTISSAKQTGEKKKTERLNKYRRQKSKAPNIILQPRDVAILVAVNDYLGFLTREQIQTLFFGIYSPHESKSGKVNSNGLKRASHRLKLLFHNGYLDRYSPRRDRQGIADYRDMTARLFAPRPFLYHLTEAGAKVVAEAKGIPFSEVNYKRKFRERDEAKLFHEMTINDFRITLTLAERAHKNIKILQWRSEKECFQPYTVKDKTTGKVYKRIFHPDAFFQLQIIDNDSQGGECQTSIINSFLEIDTGTESHTHRIIDKVNKYKEFTKEGYFKKEYDPNGKFRVIFLTTQTEQRIINMKNEVEKLVKGVFWFVVRNVVLYNPKFLFESFWLKAGKVDDIEFLK